MKKINYLKAVILFLVLTTILTGCSQKNQDFVTINIWHYYNGAQKIAFDEMVKEFNETIGFEKKIYVEAFSQGNIDNLEESIISSIEKKVGAKDIPNIVTLYPDITLKIDKEGYATNLNDYLTAEEIGGYVDSYIEEGYINEEKKLKIFPIAKATEILMVNKTDWDIFSNETGADIKELETWEGLAEIAKLYYEWTDSNTEAPDDGKSFFGRDAMANYIIIGAKQLGQEIFRLENDNLVLNIDHDTFKKLWDNFYTPFVKGYYSSRGRFSSDDAKVGEIIALVGSTTGAAYFPDNITINDNDSYDIESLMLPVPNFKGTPPLAIQQGAGMVVLKSNKVSEKASVEFLKWFTDTSRNIGFAIESGYLPVTKESNNLKSFIELVKEDNKNNMTKQVEMALPVAMDQMLTYDLHISKAFKNSQEARQFLTTSLYDKAKSDREEILRLIDSGLSRKDAIDQVASDDNFEQWFLDFSKELKSIVNN